MLANQIACPRCRTVLTLPQPLPAGQMVQCPRCGVQFAVTPPPPTAVRPGNGRGKGKYPTAAPAGPLRAAPAPFPSILETPPRQGPNWTVLTLLLVGVLVFLGGGIALAVFCFAGGKPPEDNQQAAANGVTPASPGTPANIAPPVRPKEAAKPPQPAKKPEEARPHLPPDQRAKVKQAIDKGVAYLRSIQKPDGTWKPPGGQLGPFQVGFTALPALTLLECGAPKDDPAVQKAADFIRAQVLEPVEFEQLGSRLLTYNLSLAILFLDRLGDPKDEELIRQIALHLVAGQTVSGGWTYYCPVLTEAEGKGLLSLLQRNQAVTPSPLDLKRVEASKLTLGGAAQVPDRLKHLAVWRNDTDNQHPGVRESDNSNTQFAILALWAAKGHDMPLQRTLALIVKRFRKGQNADGSWGYLAVGRETVRGVKHPTMTCAGLLGLAVGLGLTNEARAKGGGKAPAAGRAEQDPQVARGLEHLAGHIDNPNTPWRGRDEAPLIDLYYLWSVERVGVIFNLARIGGKDWYAWGAEKLVANQTPQGNWRNGQYSHATPPINTCFALLFLKRANLAKDLTAKLFLSD